MREYGTIDSAVWNHPDFKKLSDDAKLLFCYLKTSGHNNLIGCFHLPIPYITGDLRWSLEKCNETLSELFQDGFATSDQEFEFIYLPKHLEAFPIQNENQAKAALKLAHAIPSKFEYFPTLAKSLLESYDYSKGFKQNQAEYEPYLTRIDTLSIALQNGSETVAYSVTVTGTGTVTSSSSEPEKTVSEPAEIKDESEVFCEIPLTKKDGSYSITRNMLDEWRADYPAIDIEQTVINIKNWSVSNPSKRKTSKGILKHIFAWLGKEQDKGGGKNAGNGNGSSKSTGAGVVDEGCGGNVNL
jgi:hypothetical protein